jgi:dihydroxy-acid dehydratase
MSSNSKDKKSTPESGLRKGLTSYGDKGFSLFLRKAFIKGAGYTNSALDRPVIGIITTLVMAICRSSLRQ